MSMVVAEAEAEVGMWMPPPTLADLSEPLEGYYREQGVPLEEYEKLVDVFEEIFRGGNMAQQITSITEGCTVSKTPAELFSLIDKIVRNSPSINLSGCVDTEEWGCDWRRNDQKIILLLKKFQYLNIVDIDRHLVYLLRENKIPVKPKFSVKIIVQVSFHSNMNT